MPSPTTPTEFVSTNLGITGLPSLMDNLSPGGIYMLLAETATTRYPILASSLNQAQLNGLMSTVILPVNPEVFVQRLETTGLFSVAERIGSNRLKLFITQDEFSKKMFKYGPKAFLEELDFFQVPDGAFLLFDQADELFGLHDASVALEQVQALRQWTQSKGVTLLAVLTRVTEDRLSVINGLMDDLSGLARLGANRSGLELNFEYWQSRDGTVAGRGFALVTDERGLYTARAQTNLSTGTETVGMGDAAPEAPPSGELQYFYMDPDLGSLAQQIDGKWTLVDTLVGMMHATRNLRWATCILMFKRDTNLRQLAEAVHTLRQTLGRYAHIVVQEKEASLRYQNEALLLKLGLNLAINRDVPVSRIPLLLDSLKGQIFSRDVDVNFEGALASVIPSHVHGYLTPLRFIRETSTIVERAETLNIPSALIIGEPGRNTQIEDILSQSTLSRPGDLITASSDDCYIFLNACPQAAVLKALERVLTDSVDHQFANVRFVVTRDEIKLELANLQHLAEKNNLPDYSDIASTVESAGAAPALPTAPVVPAAGANTTVARPAAEPAVSAQTPRPKVTLRVTPPAEPGSARAPLIARGASPVQHLQPAPTAARSTAAAPGDGAPAAALPENAASPETFEYDGLGNVKTFGKSAAPRAARRGLIVGQPSSV